MGRVWNSKTQKGIKYYFDEFKTEKESVEKGNVNPNSKGTVIETLEVSFINNSHHNHSSLLKILDDCEKIPIEIYNRGFDNLKSYLEQMGQGFKSYYGNKENIYVHKIRT